MEGIHESYGSDEIIHREEKRVRTAINDGLHELRRLRLHLVVPAAILIQATVHCTLTQIHCMLDISQRTVNILNR